MTSERNDIDYSGPSRNYKAPRGDIYAPEGSYEPNIGVGYANAEKLIEDLSDYKIIVKKLYESAKSELRDYSVLIDTSNTQLVESHKMSYPDDLTPGSVSFLEYIYNFSKSRATSSSYVNKYYETKLRGPNGTNALDIAHVVIITLSEITRIENFLDKFLGDIDEPSEFRVLESFQDWLQDSKSIIDKFRTALQTKAVTKIPKSELDQLDENKAREFQALFQSKLNVINKAISDVIGQLYKEWDEPASVYYNKYLGPSLSFNIKVANRISTGISVSDMPVLSQEAAATTAGLGAQLRNAMADQLKRNRLYYDLLESVLNNIVQRDVYVVYLSQLSDKGKVIPSVFKTQLEEEPEVIEKSDQILSTRAATDYQTNASSDHSFITGRDDPDAHPQYVKNTGDVLTGSFELTGDFYLNEANVSDIVYVKDGNSVVGASYIDWDDVSNSDVSVAGNVFDMEDLEISNTEVLADDRIRYTVKFNVESEDIANYEFEIIEL